MLHEKAIPNSQCCVQMELAEYTIFSVTEGPGSLASTQLLHHTSGHMDERCLRVVLLRCRWSWQNTPSLA